MVQGLIGRKLGMTQMFDERGIVHPVTVVETGPCVVTQVRTEERDGYEAVQLGFGLDKRLNKPEQGHVRASGFQSKHLREFRADDVDAVSVGQVIKADLFTAGDQVDVTGTSKGRGFQGGVKRHGFAGGPATHGQSDRHRAPGSIGSSATPGRVFKGLRMAGHMGHERVTVQNLEVLRVDTERNLLLIKGSVPGPNKGLVMVRRAAKRPVKR
ncbi:MAG: LSU ribosomal protein L3p (L3e) [uncultured Thermomicrobiales bacterium]|uniref:Large ribosomal subunit protein uL3 n=1 Tax=uncultured Thermomicrobiales bacterium TaxID=1645740 RepID=A0A6J4UUB9_9BACT|nr:MAG: LSU ribosomal protein L3p (L3e) [uncultured Thermomicrobiales bacterium]